jgi:hypothetical protein
MLAQEIAEWMTQIASFSRTLRENWQSVHDLDKKRT